MSLGKHNIHPKTQGWLAPRQRCVSYSDETIGRFWAKVERRGTSECWLWTASVTGSQSVKHGQFTLPRDAGKARHIKAHRFAWELAHGPIPAGLFVCHHCDVARCCNPAHLFIGTQAVSPRMAKADCKRLAEAEWRRRIGKTIERSLELSGLSKQELSYAMKYQDQSALSRRITGVERPLFDKLFAVDSFYDAWVIATAEGNPRMEVRTVIEIRRTA